ncbi:MAG: hypothetical protein OXG58_03820 [Gemmatimonadetes bacterium]|nr:hypothetical protein [Gemmatimonadota bacterium]MCY3942706.1 hypothetical protein [Gemmatimonadota bacterium]
MRMQLATAASAILAVGCAPAFAGSELVAQERDFLLSTPRASISLRAGVSVPRAEGGGSRPSLWDFAREQLTVETNDLTGAYLLGEIGVRASEHVDFVLAVGYTSSAVRSEYRHWVDTDDLPIEQTTEFTTTPVTVGVRYYPLPRGRQVGSYAWIPNAVGPFVGIAGGGVRYRFEQDGDFVDDETLDIYSDNLRSVEASPTLHLFAGLDASVNTRMLLTTEVRYGFASAPLDDSFKGFADLDLAGLHLSCGLTFRL